MIKLLKTKNYKLETNSGGFIALVTVLIIFAITLLIGLSVSLLSINEAQMGLKKF